MEANVGSGTRVKNRKKRFLSQVVTPAAPTYRHKTVGSNGVMREA